MIKWTGFIIDEITAKTGKNDYLQDPKQVQGFCNSSSIKSDLTFNSHNIPFQTISLPELLFIYRLDIQETNRFCTETITKVFTSFAL